MPSWAIGMQPRWVQMPITTSHWSWPALTRASSLSRIGQARDHHAAGLVDLLLGAMADVDRLAAPEHLDVLSLGNRRQIDLDRRAGRNGRSIRIYLGNQRPHGGGCADRGDGSRCNKKKITACWMVRRRRCRHEFQALSHLQPAEPPRTRGKRSREAAGARGPRGGRKTAFPPPIRRNSSPELFYWHPCRASASPLSARNRAMH